MLANRAASVGGKKKRASINFTFNSKALWSNIVTRLLQLASIFNELFSRQIDFVPLYKQIVFKSVIGNVTLRFTSRRLCLSDPYLVLPKMEGDAHRSNGSYDRCYWPGEGLCQL
jgi:hypothetical protein